MAKKKRTSPIVGVLTLVLLCFTLVLLVIQSNKTQELRQHAASSLDLPDPLFMTTSPWNQPIGTNVELDPNSTAMVEAVSSRVNPTDNAFGMPLYISTTIDPICDIHTGDSLFNSKQPIHVPSNAMASTGDDHWLFIYDTTKNLIFEMWLAKKNGNCWSADTGNVYDPSGDGVLQPDGSPQDGNGGSYFGGVVNVNDVKRGYINHALSLASQATKKNVGRYPMNQQTDGNSNGIVPMGARFQLDPTFNCDGMSGASKGEVMVCHAMQTYGGYVHDTGGVPMSIYFQEDKSAGGVFTAIGIDENQPFTHIPWNKMRVLKSWNSYTLITPTQAVVSNTSTPVPTMQPGPTGSLGKSTITFNFSVCPHGIGNCGDSTNPDSIGNSNPLHTQRNITLSLVDSNKRDIAQQEGKAVYSIQQKNFQGNIIITNLPNGIYTAFLKMDGFLKKQFPGNIIVSQNQTLLLPTLFLVNGDINNDNQLSILDYSILKNCFEQKFHSSFCIVPATTSSPGPDLNDDGVVTGSDYNLFLREFIKQ